MTKERTYNHEAAGHLAPVVRLTQAGMVAERLAQALWKVWSVLLGVVAALWLGLPEMVPSGVFIAIIAGAGAMAVAFLVQGMRRFRWPRSLAALERLDASLPMRPLQALRDTLAIGTGDPMAQSLWAAHQQRMRQQVAQVRPVAPDLRLAHLDPYGMRYLALLCFVVAMLYGSAPRMGASPTPAVPIPSPVAATLWEGWAAPPHYTGRATLYLNEVGADSLELPLGTRITLRFYGSSDEAQRVQETVSDPGTTQTQMDESGAQVVFDVMRTGRIAIAAGGGQEWRIQIIPDAAPHIAMAGEVARSERGEMTLPFQAQDDYAVVEATARLELNLPEVVRRHGLAVPPEPRAPTTLDLPLPLRASRAAFTETLVEDLSQHPWAHLPVKLYLSARDGAGNSGHAAPITITLPARRFFDPLAAALIEQRRDLLWSRENAPRVARLLRALSHAPQQGLFARETDYLRLRAILRRLETHTAFGLTPAQQDAIATALWDLALRLEDGNAEDTLQRLQQARDRLAEAMRNGASADEIARLMQELRAATQAYLREKAQQQSAEGGEQPPSDNALRLDMDDLQRMLDRIEELMAQNRMAEAQQAMEEFLRMLENLQVAQGEGRGESRAVEELGETLRQQQGLSDQAFRQLQEQFRSDAQVGQSPGNEGMSGGSGRGQSHEGQGQGRSEGSGAQGQQPGAPTGNTATEGEGAAATLAERQNALRQDLARQRGSLPGGGTAHGEAARDALENAETAMQQAERALRGGLLGDALDHQSNAVGSLREGLRALNRALAEGGSQGEQGTRTSPYAGASPDPLGRDGGAGFSPESRLRGGAQSDERARALRDEIRRRAGEQSRSKMER
ncbi:MAG: TIGR02302 family protein, partial [Rhodobacteraceae bacterium]|nr:TIGR02302 family protein [Paracoccaceae bacterium]